MSKAVLISIRPKWCELIASGKKTVEVRKTAPKIEPPFKCYIYETRGFERVGNDNLNCIIGGGGRGMVIGEFLCAEIDRYARYGWLKEPARYMKSSPGGYPATEIHYSSLQLSPDALEQYGKGEQLFGWHIADLLIYDKPKELSDFRMVNMECLRHGEDGVPVCEKGIFCQICKVRRPPQSWCYVEEGENAD